MQDSSLSPNFRHHRIYKIIMILLFTLDEEMDLQIYSQKRFSAIENKATSMIFTKLA